MTTISETVKKTIRAYRAAEKSIRADADGTAPFATETERRATERIRDSAREAIIAAGMSPEVILSEEDAQLTGPLMVWARGQTWGNGSAMCAMGPLATCVDFGSGTPQGYDVCVLRSDADRRYIYQTIQSRMLNPCASEEERVELMNVLMLGGKP